jgi:DNA-binding NarL/FixJ family response regulator
MIKVLIADDHAVVRRGLKQILAETSDMIVAGEAVSGPDTLDKVRDGEWDALVLDITMPGRSGLDILKQLKRERPRLPVLVLSVHSEAEFAMRALKAGASGYMTKESASDELAKALRIVSEGGKYIGAHMAELMALEIATGSAKPLHKNLSDREYEVMRMIGSGRTVTEIAKELSLSVKTVSAYRARVLDKLNMTTNAQLIRYVIKNGLED